MHVFGVQADRPEDTPAGLPADERVSHVTNKKPHLSATQLEMYCRCPESYRRRYIEGEVIPPGIALLKGSGFHKGAEVNMRQKIDTHRDLPVSDVVDAAVAAFEEATAGEYVLTEEEESRGATVVVSEAKDDLAEMATVHAKDQAPDYQPVAVEKRVLLELPEAPRDLLGIIDLVDDQDRVVDFKTAGRKKSQDEADVSTQLTVYAAAFVREHNTPPSELRLDCVVQTKTRTTRQVVTTQRDSADFAALAARINAVTQAIAAGSFPPALPGTWWCSDRFCGYWRTCPFVNSERKALAAS